MELSYDDLSKEDIKQFESNRSMPIIENILTCGLGFNEDFVLTSRLVVMNLTLFIGAFFFSIYSLVTYHLGDFLLFYIKNAFALYFVIMFFYARLSKHFLRIAYLLLIPVNIYFLFLIYYGGEGTFGSLWIYSSPLFTLFFLGLASGRILLLLILVLVFIMLFSPLSSYLIVDYKIQFKQVFFTILLMISIFSYLFEYYRQETFRRLTEMNKQLSIDIKEREKSEELLKKQRNKASFYMDLLAHDINNLNMPITSHIELLLRQKEFPEEFNRYLDIVLDQGKAISALIENVRTLESLHPDSFELVSIDLFPIIKQAKIRVSLNHPEKNITLNHAIPTETLVRGHNLLQDVFENILGNAIKYNRSKEVIINVKHNIIDNGSKIRLEISDNGPGIPDEKKKTIFKRLTRGEKSIHGSGLGLSIVREIIRACKGKVWVEDNIHGDYTQGANFVIELNTDVSQSSAKKY